jgi:probable phosphoglycerate mutase
MQLLLARHGNTFRPGEPVLWVGSRNDLPLVARGREQARTLGRALRERGTRPEVVYCGPLARTREYAAIVAEEAGLPTPDVDARLDELDYGVWSGLTSNEVVERFGEDELEGWRRRGEWPAKAGFGPGEEQVRREVHDLVRELVAEPAPDTVLLVTSNGRLRYFLTLVPGAFEQCVERDALGVRTGHISKIVGRATGFAVDYWDLDPATAEAL